MFYFHSTVSVTFDISDKMYFLFFTLGIHPASSFLVSYSAHSCEATASSLEFHFRCFSYGLSFRSICHAVLAAGNVCHFLLGLCFYVTPYSCIFREICLYRSSPSTVINTPTYLNSFTCRPIIVYVWNCSIFWMQVVACTLLVYIWPHLL